MSESFLLKITDQFWHFSGIVLLTFIAAINGRIGSFGTLPMIVFKLPCTILHELAHLLVGFLTGGHPAGLSLLPSRITTSERPAWQLGSVTLRNPGALSCFPTALAPLLYIPLAYLVYCLWTEMFISSAKSTIGMYLTIGILLGSSVPSSSDIRVAFASSTGTIFYLGIILCAVTYLFMNYQ
jgi:hypothetical protein